MFPVLTRCDPNQFDSLKICNAMLIYISILFILNPFVGILMLAFHIYRNNQTFKWEQVRVLAIFISCYLALINTTKEMSGDFLTYSAIYYDALENDYISYILSAGKEPIYYTLSWIICRITSANYPIFVFIYTTINYIAIFEAIIIIAKNNESRSSDIIASMFFIAFFFQNFAMIGNLVRQCISQSFTLLFFSKLFYGYKKSWIYAIIALGFHTASLPIIGIGIIPFVRKRMNMKNILVLVITTTFVALCFTSLSGVLSNIPFVGYIFMRLNDDNLTGTEDWQTEVGISLQYYILILILAYMIYYTYNKRVELINNIKSFAIINIAAILTIALLFWNACANYYLLMRYQFYLYALIMITTIVFFSEFRNKYKSVIELSICILMPVYFFYYLQTGFFRYESVIEALTRPVVLYFL